MGRFSHLHIPAMVLIAVSMFVCTACGGRSQYADEMDRADAMMESHPDSAMMILEGIGKENLRSERERARYALLMSMALDKNYVDTTTFDVLQPAIDYYLKKGSADERLRTYYYQGRIYQNAEDYEKSMDAFIYGRDLFPQATDTLTMARLLTAQGTLFYKQYKFRQFVDNSLLSARLFGKRGMIENEYKSLIKSLGGAILLSDRALADSIRDCCQYYFDKIPNAKSFLDSHAIRYHATFDKPNELEEFVDKIEITDISTDNKFNLAYANSKIGKGEKALEYLNDVLADSNAIPKLKYLSIKTSVYESAKDYENALNAYKEYNSTQERHTQKLISDGLLFAERRHEMEMASEKALRHKDHIIMIWSVCGIGLIMMISFLYYRYRIGRTQKEMAEMKAENMERQIRQLEEERDELNEILNRKELTDSMQAVVKERLMMLNARLSKDITDGGGDSAVYDRWIKSIKKDAEKFMQSNQMAYRVSHPKFIAHLEEHGLTEHEINYVCLYALGMLGKEVGEFTKLKGHYNLSTIIRKKLGIEENATALKVYVKNLLAEE